MPETKGAKKVFRKMQGEYGKKAGERIYYATANKQGRSKASFKKECMENFFKAPELSRTVNSTLLNRISKKISKLHEADMTMTGAGGTGNTSGQGFPTEQELVNSPLKQFVIRNMVVWYDPDSRTFAIGDANTGDPGDSYGTYEELVEAVRIELS